MILPLNGYVRDGSRPAGTISPGVPVAVTISWPKGEDGTLALTIRKADLTAYDLTGSTLVCGVRRYSTDPVPVISRQAVIVDATAGRADVVLVSADTLALTDDWDYLCDVQLIDSAGRRWQVVPRSRFHVDATFAQAGDPSSLPADVEPLLLEPSWLWFSQPLEVGTDGSIVEQLPDGLEAVWNFDDGMGELPNVLARLTGLADVSGGVGTVRVRVGGTPGLPDGTLLLASDPVVALLPTIIEKAATALRPAGAQLVKVTLQNSMLGEITRLRGLTLRVRGSL